MLYRIAKATNDKAESEHNAQLLGLQAAQYDNLKKYLDSTSRLRHDFVYMAKTAQTLAANGETEQLRQLLSDYGSSIDATSAPAFYCDNKALNAITDYYVNDARRKGIKLTAKLNVACDIVISDYELCSIVGNVLDNAVAAAEKAAEPNSEILFVADTKKNGDLYIAVSNPYSGEIKEKGGKFSSTKAGGHGIGLESIRAIVRKNNGYCNFRYDKKKFYSEIMLRQG
jgi:sensor histidine kinase regulating citrate/malate metabolism